MGMEDDGPGQGQKVEDDAGIVRDEDVGDREQLVGVKGVARNDPRDFACLFDGLGNVMTPVDDNVFATACGSQRGESICRPADLDFRIA